MLQQLRGFDVDRCDMDDMIALLAFGKQIATEYSGFGMTVPEWLEEKLNILHGAIHAKRRDALARELKLAKQRMEQLKSTEERRAEAAERIRTLEALLK